MRKVELPSRDIEHYGSRGFRHMLVPSGSVVCSTRDDELTLGVGEAVEWQEGEWHETRSREKSHLLIVEGAFE